MSDGIARRYLTNLGFKYCEADDTWVYNGNFTYRDHFRPDVNIRIMGYMNVSLSVLVRHLEADSMEADSVSCMNLNIHNICDIRNNLYANNVVVQNILRIGRDMRAGNVNVGNLLAVSHRLDAQKINVPTIQIHGSISCNGLTTLH